MFCTVSQKAKAMMALIAVSAGLVIALPEAALSQHTTLRNPLLPSASTAAPGSVAATGQAPPIGHGSSPLPVHPGDIGGLQPPPSSFADPTHGNIFPIRGGAPTDFPAPYVDGAGRHQTEAGQQSGLFDWGQGNGGSGMGPGGPNGGTGWINNGGSAPGSSGMGPGGTNGGTFWGPGGPNGGTGMFDNGGAAGGASGRGPGGPNGGTFWGPGGSNGGSGLTNNGGPAAGASGMGPGGSNGGTGTFEGGGGSTGTGVMDSGGSTGVGVVNNGGNAGGTGLVNNGGAAPGAIGTPENPRAITPHSARYDFNGVLPTVRTFSRYLVILGVVSGTVFMALAAWSMVFGSPYGGSRVIGAAGGLILLLMGYTIWKIVQMNTFHGNSTGWESRYQNGAPQQIPGPGGGIANPGGVGGGPRPPAGPAPGPGPGPGPGGPIGGPGNPGGP